MVTYYLSFFLCVIHWDNANNCKVWTKRSMVMLGASCRLITLKFHLDWASKWWNALDICVVRMIIIFYFNVLLCAMKFLSIGIVRNFWFLGNVSWNSQFVPSAISSTLLPPRVYKLVVVECIMLFTNFQIFQEPQSTWAPMPILLQMASVDNPFRRWRTWLYTRSVTRQLLLLWPLLYLQIKHFFHHLFNEDGKGPMEILKGEKLDQMLLKFVPLCSPKIRNVIASLKHHPGNFNSIDYILKLKACLVMTIFKIVVFLVNKQGKRFICSRCLSMELHPDLI
jgi:hypothetical protein